MSLTLTLTCIDENNSTYNGIYKVVCYNGKTAYTFIAQKQDEPGKSVELYMKFKPSVQNSFTLFDVYSMEEEFIGTFKSSIDAPPCESPQNAGARKVHIGSRGGKYILIKGKRKYLTSG